MSIKYAILGFLSCTPLTGYELKKMVGESEFLPWSGNNNQIYRTLVKLHQNDLVTKKVEHQESLPSRKIYTITEKGMSVLKEWVLRTPDLPQLKNSFLIQLAWADQLSLSELMTLIKQYEDELTIKLLMLREQAKHNHYFPERTSRERYIWDMITTNRISFFENELDWVSRLYGEIGTIF